MLHSHLVMIRVGGVMRRRGAAHVAVQSDHGAATHCSKAVPNTSASEAAACASSSGSHGSSSSNISSHGAATGPAFHRRLVVQAGGGIAVLAAAAALSSIAPPAAEASKLGSAVDSAWEALGGGPADLTFPESFLGSWDVVSTLVRVDTPLGADAPPNVAAVERARRDDLNRPISYQCYFMRNRAGKVVFDRRANTAALMSAYYPNIAAADLAGRIAWDPDDPNILQLRMPPGASGGLDIRTRVTRRSQRDDAAAERLETSEFVEQVLEGEAAAGAPRVKASQCFTKFKYRDAAAAGGGPEIVATQVVSDYLTPYDGERAYLNANGRPVAVYTYRLAFTRRGCGGGGGCAGLTVS